MMFPSDDETIRELWRGLAKAQAELANLRADVALLRDSLALAIKVFESMNLGREAQQALESARTALGLTKP